MAMTRARGCRWGGELKGTIRVRDEGEVSDHVRGNDRGGAHKETGVGEEGHREGAHNGGDNAKGAKNALPGENVEQRGLGRSYRRSGAGEGLGEMQNEGEE